MIRNKRSIRFIVATIVGATSLLLSSNSASLAEAQGPPRIFHRVSDQTIDFPASSTTCGFDVVQQIHAELLVRVFFDDDGNRIRAIQSFPVYEGTYTNLSNGKSVPFSAHGPVLRTFNADGSFTDTIPGVFSIVVPGSGLISLDAGRYIFTYFLSDPANGTIEISGGHFDNGPFPYICPYLQ
jgi:hypothetical protein